MRRLYPIDHRFPNISHEIASFVDRNFAVVWKRVSGFFSGVPTRPTGKDAAVDRCPGVHYYVIISKRRVFRC